jgi:hypothetical protein
MWPLFQPLQLFSGEGFAGGLAGARVCGCHFRTLSSFNWCISLKSWRYILGIKEAKERIDKLAQERKDRLGKDTPPPPPKPLNPIQDEPPTPQVPAE